MWMQHPSEILNDYLLGRVPDHQRYAMCWGCNCADASSGERMDTIRVIHAQQLTEIDRTRWYQMYDHMPLTDALQRFVARYGQPPDFAVVYQGWTYLPTPTDAVQR